MHAHDRGNVSVVLSGQIRERTTVGEHEAGPGSVVLKPTGTRHADRFGPSGAQVLLVDLGAEGVDAEETAPASAATVLDEWRWLEGGALSRALFGLWRAYGQSPAKIGRHVEEVLYSLPGLVEEEPPPRRASGAPSWLVRTRARIRAEFDDPPLVRELATEAGVHPTHLTRRFKAHFGMTVTGLVRRVRVREAARLMAADDRPLARVALDAGFADQSHFCRVFKAETGLTPGQYRALL